MFWPHPEVTRTATPFPSPRLCQSLGNRASCGQAAPEDDRFATAREVWPTLRKPELLLLAGLFHDIAKGRGGDHSEVGAEDAQAFCAAHALPAADTALV